MRGVTLINIFAVMRGEKFHPESIMKTWTCKVVLTFKSVDKILWCNHSNETSSAALPHGTICFSVLYKMKFGFLLKFKIWHFWESNGSDGGQEQFLNDFIYRGPSFHNLPVSINL